ncbi:MAG: hypothetical protein C5B59_09440 [Bacteroidetes bacterium]|nr:MAG: hypothetical protein C5B59_09440 [Bacteroidota bacterium]
MSDPDQRGICQQCNSAIDALHSDKSVKKYGYSLCEDCQIWFITKVFNTTRETIQLYFALKARGIHPVLEVKEGLKRNEIIFPQFDIHIEVDCHQHHHYHRDEALKDLENICQGYQGGICELQIPQALIRWNLNETADILSVFIVAAESKQNNSNRRA